MQLTTKQTNVLYKIVQGVKNDEMEQTLGGYAGTGKTTLIKYIKNFFPQFAVAAYTGKAANVLRKKGLSASTIHSRIYIPEIVHGVLVGFELAPRDDLGCKGFIIDEASMVSEEIYEDLASYDLPMIYVGDHGQLEPIGNGFNLMQDPMYRLEEIHRNANDIAKFAETLRKGRNSFQFRGTEDRVDFLAKKSVSDDDLMSVEQVIVAYNATRVSLNKRIRSTLGYDPDKMQVGDRVMCLKNNKELNLFNGMQGVVKNLYENRNGKKMMDFEFDDTLYEGIWYDTRYFNCEKPEYDYVGQDNPNPFDYAYAITCHKAQGDEWESGLVYEQKCKNWDHKRWAYTAASRFKETLKWAYC